MKKILVIADLHWLNVWKKLVEKDEYDKIVFLWDYVDSFTVPDNDMIQNLRDIVQYKKDNNEKVELLLGNHDIQYIWRWNRCSWYRHRIALVLEWIFQENLDLFKIFHEEVGYEWSPYLFSHAWVTNSWKKENQSVIEGYFSDGFSSYEELNMLLKTHNKDVFFQCWPERGWHHNVSWPLWADKSDTTEDGIIKWFTQIVWHTKVNKKTILPHIIYCDCLEHWDWEPLVLEI